MKQPGIVACAVILQVGTFILLMIAYKNQKLKLQPFGKIK
jgi:hypothetical protein